MTALAEKLKDAGADTVGAQLTTVCIDGLRLWPGCPKNAWDHAFNAFGRQFVTAIMADMGTISHAQEKSLRVPGEPVVLPPREMLGPKPYTPRVIPPERLEKRRDLQQVVRSKYKNSAGVSWSEVGWHELVALSRDGKEARALMEAGPAMVPNNGCTVGQVLGVDRTDVIIANLRG